MGDGGFGGGSGRGNAGVNAVGSGKGTWSTRSGGDVWREVKAMGASGTRGMAMAGPPTLTRNKSP
eukprot:5199968-Prymnesium_polylepis.1